MSSSAVASRQTQPTSRKATAAPGQGAADPVASQRYSTRQAKAYKPEDLQEFEVPQHTIKDLLSAIPKHCFQRSALKFSSYVVRDFVLVAALGYAASWINPTVASIDFKSSPLTPYVSGAVQAATLKWSAWAMYWFWQGLVMTGLWVCAHEAGHQAASESKTFNNAIGWVLHSALLVPYHSWRISHARHHAATGHLTRDEVFVPKTRAQKGLLPLRPAEQTAESDDEQQQVDAGLSSKPDAVVNEETESWGEFLAELFEDAPAYAFVYLLVQQLLGWPLYLIKNSSGQLHYPKGTSHFHPDSIIFDKRHRMQIIASDIGVGLTVAALAYAAHLTSFGTVMKYYGIPYICVNHWLVMITFLQHTDPLLPHYTADVWTFPRGALCTIDRKWMGPLIGPHLLHGIAETHVAHHINSKIPHYNAWEATEALKAHLGPHYHCTDENVWVSLWKTIRKCRFVDEGDKVAFYRDAHGVPARAVRAKEAESDSGVALSE
ncbi:unnamed protein product [Jaminaea pallidilutea]